MLNSNMTPADTKDMARLQDYDPVLFNRVLQFEWAILIVCAVGEGVAFRFGPPDPTAPNLGVSLILLAIFSLVSSFAPVREPYWDRFCYLLLQLELVTGAAAAGLARFIFPLFMITVAKSCLLLDKRGIYAIQILTCLSQICYHIYKVVLTLREEPRTAHVLDHLSLISAGGLLSQAIVACYVNLVMVVLVAMLTQSLVSAQKNRMESERLSTEVQNLATELERTRIAREIHDSLGHTLTSLNIQLEIARKFQQREPERCTSSIAMAKELASQSLKDVRMAIHHIRTSADFDLRQAVNGLVNDMQKMETSIDVQLNLGNVDVPPAVGFQLFRVIQECLTNVLKHADAKNVRIELEQTRDNLALKVCDDGKGLDLNTTSASAGGFGLKGVQERIAGLNGTVTINTEANQGTDIQVLIPLKAIQLDLGSE